MADAPLEPVVQRSPVTMEEIVRFFARMPILYEDEPNDPVAVSNPLDMTSIQAFYGRIPILYEDDKAEELDMGEASYHTDDIEALHIGLKGHFRPRPEVRVFANLNLYYRDEPTDAEGRPPYVSPDNMIVVPYRPMPAVIKSYGIGRDGPSPLTTMEVLSERSAQERDLGDKLPIYSLIGVAEYILVDTTGQFLPQKLLLKRLQADHDWKDERDADGGVTSVLGFRLVIDEQGLLRVVDSGTGSRYSRPDEAREELRAAAERIEGLEAEVERLRARERGKPAVKGGKKRRKKK
jgi:Uma2 family endonuclease